MQTDSLSPPPCSLAVALQAGIKQVGCCRCPARRHALMGAALGWHPAALEPLGHTATGGAWRSARVLRGARPRSPPPSPQGEEQLMGTCDFFHQWTQTQPSPAQGGGRARGEKKKKNFSWRPRRVAQVLAQGKGGPPTRGRECGAARPCPALRLRPSPATTRPADLATWARTWLGRRERGLEGMRESGMRTVRKRSKPPRRPQGSGGASAARVPSAALGRRRGALLAVAAAGGGRAHGGSGPT